MIWRFAEELRSSDRSKTKIVKDTLKKNSQKAEETSCSQTSEKKLSIRVGVHNS